MSVPDQATTQAPAPTRVVHASPWGLWLPAAAATVACGALLVAYGTPLVAVLLTVAYYLVAVVLPGVLLWRFLAVRPVSRLEDLALGAALGLAVQVAVRWALTPLGLQHLAAVWVLAVVALSLTPRGRRVWRYDGPPPRSSTGAWVIAAAVVGAAWWVANTSFRLNEVAPVPGAAPGEYYPVAPYVDLPFQQALAWAVDGPWPLAYPYVPDSPLTYTLMVYEHLADVARWTGVDLTLVVMRLHTLPLVALALLMCVVVAMRLTSRAPGAGPVAAVLAAFAAPLSLYPWTPLPFIDGGTLNLGTFRSPTQTFGEPIFLALVAVACLLLRPSQRRSWWLLAPMVLLAFVAGGAKATFLPLIGCGAALAACAAMIWARRDVLPAVVTGAVAVLCAGAALLLVTGTSSRSLQLGDGRQVLSRMPFSEVLGDVSSIKVLAAGLGIVLLAWAVPAAGAAFLVRWQLRDPRTWFLLGIVVAGMAATVIGTHPGLSQLYFLRSAWPVLAILSASGLCLAVARLTDRPRHGLRRLVGLLGLGAVTVLGVQTLPMPGPEEGVAGWRGLVVLLAPWAALAVLLAAVALVVLRSRGRLGVSPRATARGVAALAVAAVLVGGSLTEHVTNGSLTPVLPGPGYGSNGAAIPADGATAARWLREHAGPSDVVATNAHCIDGGDPTGGCDARHFWIAALSERQVLLEGWSYSNPPAEIAPGFTDRGPFWDPDLLRRNDAVFSEPTAPLIESLRAEHGVEWLFVDRSVGPESAELEELADLVLELPGAAVYRLRGGDAAS